MAPAVGYLESIIPFWPDLFSQDALSILEATYLASPAKAENNLGWKTRDLEIGMRETFDWIGSELQPFTLTQSQKTKIGVTVLGAAIGLMLLWLTKRQRRS